MREIARGPTRKARAYRAAPLERDHRRSGLRTRARTWGGGGGGAARQQPRMPNKPSRMKRGKKEKGATAVNQCDRSRTRGFREPPRGLRSRATTPVGGRTIDRATRAMSGPAAASRPRATLRQPMRPPGGSDTQASERQKEAPVRAVSSRYELADRARPQSLSGGCPAGARGASAGGPAREPTRFLASRSSYTSRPGSPPSHPPTG